MVRSEFNEIILFVDTPYFYSCLIDFVPNVSCIHVLQIVYIIKLNHYYKKAINIIKQI